MSTYDWLLFLHVAAAFVLVAAVILLWAIVLVTARGPHPAAVAFGKPAGIMVGLGSILTLVFGVWLAIERDEYQVWDGWVLAAIALWVVSVATGQRGGQYFARAGSGGPDAPALRQRGVVLNAISSLGLLLILVDMIFKPGA